MKRLKIVVLGILLGIFCLPTAAQDSDILAYGDSIQGEITNRHFEIEYEFAANAGDVVIIEMVPEDDDDFRNPGIILLDSNYDVVAEAFDSRSVTLFNEIVSDGDYFVLATRNDGRAGDGVGPFTLTLRRAYVLQNSRDLCERISSESENYYVVRINDNFNISYQFLNGDFRPEISINIIKEQSSELSTLMTLTGSGLEQGSIGTTSLDSNAPQLYLVSVKQRSWDWSSDKSAEYRLRLDTGEAPDSVELSVVATSSINIRSGPGTDFDIVGNFQNGSVALASGRNVDGSWLQLAEGWVFADLVESCGNILQLPNTSE